MKKIFIVIAVLLLSAGLMHTNAQSSLHIHYTYCKLWRDTTAINNLPDTLAGKASQNIFSVPVKKDDLLKRKWSYPDGLPWSYWFKAGTEFQFEDEEEEWTEIGKSAVLKS